MVLSKQRLLGPCELKLEVFQELGGKQASSIGDLTINLSEYVDGGALTTERFLLNHSKFNSTLKVKKSKKVEIGSGICVTLGTQIGATSSCLLV
jgi:hypothetical protein